MFGDGTLALGLAGVAQLLADRSLEETLAAFTAHSSIMPAWNITDTAYSIPLKVHKNENFFGFDFEFCPISLLVMHK